MELLYNPVLIQGLGVVAAVIGISSYLIMDDKILKYGIASATILLSIHLHLLQAHAGSILLFIAAIRFIVAAQTSDKRIGIFFIIVHLVAGYFFYQAPSDLLPIISSVNAAIAVFFLQGFQMRLMLLCSMFLWLAYHAIVGSFGGALLESFYIVANLLTLARISFGPTKSKIR